MPTCYTHTRFEHARCSHTMSDLEPVLTRGIRKRAQRICSLAYAKMRSHTLSPRVCVCVCARAHSCFRVSRVCEANARRENERRRGEKGREGKKEEREKENRARRAEYARGARRVLARERATGAVLGQKCTRHRTSNARERFAEGKKSAG